MVRLNDGGLIHRVGTPEQYRWEAQQTLVEVLKGLFPETKLEVRDIGFQQRNFDGFKGKWPIFGNPLPNPPPLPGPQNQLALPLAGPVAFRTTTLNHDDPSGVDDNSVFSRLFTLEKMAELADITFERTDNLLDHLLIQRYADDRFRTKVFIFHHATVLAWIISQA